MRTLSALELNVISGGFNKEITEIPIFLLTLNQLFEGVAEFIVGAATHDEKFLAAYPWVEKHLEKMIALT